MRRASILAASYTLDWLIGDPQWLPHPVRAIGWSIGAAERLTRRIGSGKCIEFFAGSAVALAIPAASFALTTEIVRRAYKQHRVAGGVAEIWLASSCLATRDLLEQASRVLGALDADHIDLARRRLARIVGRDTENLGKTEICRAVIETLAESFCDGIIAPLFYLALGGAPLAMAYKAVNTLDSMIGHRDKRYLYFGRAAARIDDAANWLPARLAALLILTAAASLRAQDGVRASRIWLRDGSRHAVRMLDKWKVRWREGSECVLAARTSTVENESLPRTSG